VLSRLPLHNLAKKGRVNIHITQKNADGDITLRWDVSYSEKYGQARQLAYKLDTIVINRRLEDYHRPLPYVIRLGSLTDLAHQCRLGRDTNSGKRRCSRMRPRSLRPNSAIAPPMAPSVR